MDVGAGIPSSGDCRGHLEIENIAIVGLEQSSNARDHPHDSRSPSPDKELLSPSGDREDKDLLRVDYCVVFFVYSVRVLNVWRFYCLWRILYNSAPGIVESVFHLQNPLIYLRVVRWHSFHLNISVNTVTKMSYIFAFWFGYQLFSKLYR